MHVAVVSFVTEIDEHATPPTVTLDKAEEPVNPLPVNVTVPPPAAGPDAPSSADAPYDTLPSTIPADTTATVPGLLLSGA